MDFTPKTREEAEKESQFPIWEAGIYDFEVAKAEATISKKDNDMIKLSLNVYSEDMVQIVFDYLMPALPVKLIDACEAMGLFEEYQSGSLHDYQFEGKTGKLSLSVKGESTNKDTGKKYPSRNEVKGYVVPPITASLPAQTPNAEQDDPFNYDESPGF